MHRTALHNKNYLVPNVNSTKFENSALNKWRGISCSWIWRLNPVKMPVLKWIYKFNMISVPATELSFSRLAGAWWQCHPLSLWRISAVISSTVLFPNLQQMVLALKLELTIRWLHWSFKATLGKYNFLKNLTYFKKQRLKLKHIFLEISGDF